MNNEITSVLSFVGAIVTGLAAGLGFYVMGRGAYTAAKFVWGEARSIDQAVESDFKIRIGR